MLFSIIIPTYNRAHLIQNTLLSVLNQEFEDYEVIIIDDGSKDKTQLAVENFIKHNNLLNWNYYYKENGERGAARNYGITKATGEWITFLDSDDLYYHHHLSLASEFISKNDEISVFHSAYEFRNQKDQLLRKVSYPKNNDLNQSVLKGNVFSCFGMFVKKEVLRNCKFSDERTLSGTEDWLLWLQLSARYKIHLQPKVSGCMIQHNGRSVLGFSIDQMLARTNLLILYLDNDTEFESIYGKRVIKRIHAHMMTYIALHLVIMGQKQISIKYFMKGISMSVSELFSRRALAFFKYLFIKYSA